jgi:heterodisulfide reductase subunit A-like polyferredoxin
MRTSQHGAFSPVKSCRPRLCTHTASHLLAKRHRTTTLAAAANAGQPGETPSSSNGHHDGDSFDYDVFVIGGGSGGIRAARTAANLGEDPEACSLN